MSTPSSQPKPAEVVARLARILRDAREQRGLSMSHVAERAGLSQQMISYVERGMRVPTVDSLIRISVALDIDAAEVLAQSIRSKSKK